MSGEGKTLQLDVYGKCDGNTCSCPGGNKPTLTTSRTTSFDQVVGFVQYSHSSDESFRLLKNIGRDQELDDTELTEIKEVSVYYWDGDISHEKPLLLRVIKNGDNHAPEYYYKYGENETETGNQPNVWRHKGHNGSISLQSRLDERNLGINNRFPLYLDQPDKPLGLESDLAKSVTMQHVQPPPPQLVGGGYTITEYKLNGKSDTRFSRIMYDKENSGIKLPTGRIVNIKLYSSLEISKVPIMLQLIPDSGDSTWLASKNSNGNDWIEVGSSSVFYDSGKPTEALANKLDGLSCENYKAVTIDLTKSTSGKKEQSCSGGKDKNISVQELEASHEQSHSSIRYHRYYVGDDSKLADIKFYLDGNQKKRRRVKSAGLRFPIQGPVSVYAFYCNESPILAYVDASKSSGNFQANTGWYRRSKNGYDSPWTKLRKQLRNITHQNFRELDCDNWNTLVAVLKRAGCTAFNECPTSSPLRSDDGRDVSQTQDEAIALEESEPEDLSPGLGAAGLPGPQGPPDAGVAGKADDSYSDGKVTKTKDREDNASETKGTEVKEVLQDGAIGPRGPDGKNGDGGEAGNKNSEEAKKDEPVESLVGKTEDKNSEPLKQPKDVLRSPEVTKPQHAADSSDQNSSLQDGTNPSEGGVREQDPSELSRSTTPTVTLGPAGDPASSQEPQNLGGGGQVSGIPSLPGTETNDGDAPKAATQGRAHTTSKESVADPLTKPAAQDQPAPKGTLVVYTPPGISQTPVSGEVSQGSTLGNSKDSFGKTTAIEASPLSHATNVSCPSIPPFGLLLHIQTHK